MVINLNNNYLLKNDDSKSSYLNLFYSLTAVMLKIMLIDLFLEHNNGLFKPFIELQFSSDCKTSPTAVGT